MNSTGSGGTPASGNVQSVTLDAEGVRAMRHRLHELANVFTGVMIAGGLLSQYLEGGSLQQYAVDICENSERGSALARELRSQLRSACGEAEADSRGAAERA